MSAPEVPIRPRRARNLAPGGIAVLASVASAGIGELAPLAIKLPFENGTSFTCIQGNHGLFSHSEPHSDFAWDFDLPEGTAVLAAAAGRVVLARDEFTEHGLTPAMRDRGNGVSIDHGDGRLTVYGHLQRSSLRVAVGQLVNAGDVLARSGNTGYSTGPHLHFAVTDVLGRSVAARFLDVQGAGVPVAGQICRSGNDGRGVAWFREDSTLPADAFERDGVVLESRIPALYWKADDVHELRGRVTEPFRTVCSFWTTREVPGAIAMKATNVESDSTFRSTLKAADFDALLACRSPLTFGVAPVRGGRFDCVEMMPLSIWTDPLDADRRHSAPLRLPFRAGETHRYRRSAPELDAEDELAVELDVEAGTLVLASAAGRVVRIDRVTDTSPEQADRSSHESSTVEIDHGFGVETTYADLDPASIAVRAGEIVEGGRRLGAITKPPWRTGARLRFVVVQQRGGRRARFAELGEAATFVREGTVTAASLPEERWVFRSDSRVDSDAFREDGILGLRGLPSHAFHVRTRYEVAGDSRDPLDVAFVVRERGGTKITRIAATRSRDGAFAFDVSFAAFDKMLGDRRLEWSLETSTEIASNPICPWFPLVLMR